MEKVVISKEMIQAASDYIPLEEKEAWVADNAPKCFDKLAITADGEAMPPMYAVNVALKNRYLMAALVSMYLKQAYVADTKDEPLISREDYDKWANSHTINQIDRLKKDAEVRDKCYDILYDYRELEKMFSAQIYALLNVQNDSVIRQSEQMTNAIKELPALLEQLKELQEATANGTDG